MKLDVKLDGEDKPKRGPCPFFSVEKGLFSCGVGVKTCSHNDNIPSRCGRYWILGEKLMGQIRVACRCGRAEFKFNGKWSTREETPVPAINNSAIPEDIWNRYWPSLPKVPCGECGPKKQEERK